ncbi:MAG: hypothetical protein MR881_00045 [Bacteroidales bacterium]|nr:hypothetical protein [Bacteroidales bacterium]
MIDDKINKALTELEANLRSVRSANEQVNNTVNAYKALTTSTTAYTGSLSAVKDSVEKLVKAVGNDYDNKVAEFDKDRNQIVTSCNQVILDVNQTIQDAKQAFDDNIKQIHNKFTYVLVLNGIILLTMMLLHFLG